MSFGIRGGNLEDAGWSSGDEEEEDEEGSVGSAGEGQSENERTHLLGK